MSLNLRAAARAIILDQDDHVLLCRFVSRYPSVRFSKHMIDSPALRWDGPGLTR
ncbi:hypothetical protein [Actinoplanes sp. M2I2]|uniref:hypothetical protein n=1 Tax=Actinoplanes sp. M2I2 TaxID=1734444 RepID=UPI00202217C9|nr:hypothetical protein [Actinoplanes sp. M2I2]